MNMLAAEAARQELMSEGQLARLLNSTEFELRDLLDSSTMEGSAADGSCPA